jgi:hypothetical protein
MLSIGSGSWIAPAAAKGDHVPRRCTVCCHVERDAIGSALVEGSSIRDIAGRFESLSRASISRHKAEHLPKKLVQAKAAADDIHADGLFDKLRELELKAQRIADKAESEGELRTALAAVRELCRIVELQARMLGQVHEGPTVNVRVGTDWLALRTTILVALEPFPDARRSVIDALSSGEASHG